MWSCFPGRWIDIEYVRVFGSPAQNVPWIQGTRTSLDQRTAGHVHVEPGESSPQSVSYHIILYTIAIQTVQCAWTFFGQPLSVTRVTVTVFKNISGGGGVSRFWNTDGIGIHRWARLHWRGPTVSADMTVRQTNERIRLRRTYTHYYCDVLCTFIILPSSELHLGNTLLVVNKSSTHVSRDSAPTVNYCSHIVDTLHYNII